METMSCDKKICKCHDMTEVNIKEHVNNGADSIGKVVRMFGITRLRCAGCARNLIDYVTSLLKNK
jgi:bacterioferritin-associated ferredoxin